MDYEVVRAGLAQAIPYNAHLGLEVLEVDEASGSVRLPDQERLRNHVGSQHAGGLFSAGEAASGAALVGAFAEHLDALRPLASSAHIEYLTLARGPITAAGRLSEDRETLLARLEAAGRVEFQVEVELTDADGQTVARMSVDWHVRKSS
jgi:acyl-coenzyme A thioesterase PaaI-like protein